MKINFQNLTNSQFFRNFKISGDFFRNFIFQKYLFSDGFFSTIFFSLRIFWGCSFDAEIGPLSIYEVFRAIPALIHLVWSKFQDLGSEIAGIVVRNRGTAVTVLQHSLFWQFGLRVWEEYVKRSILPKTEEFSTLTISFSGGENRTEATGIPHLQHIQSTTAADK